MSLGLMLSALSLSLAAVSLLVAFKAVERWRLQCASMQASIAALRREFELLASISVRTGRRVQRVEHEFSGVADRVDLVESRATAGPESLDRAIDLARRGADSGRLEQQFGISSGEADLVARLHGRKKQTAS